MIIKKNNFGLAKIFLTEHRRTNLKGRNNELI